VVEENSSEQCNPAMLGARRVRFKVRLPAGLYGNGQAISPSILKALVEMLDRSSKK
jgi:hypothetical protein